MKKTINIALLYRRIFLVIYDTIAVAAAAIIALVIRYEFVYANIEKKFLESVCSFLPFTIIITLLTFALFRLYNSLWAFAGVNEMQNIVAACGIAVVCNGVGMVLFQKPVPRSYPFMFVCLLIAFTFASRFSYRFFRGLKRKSMKQKAGTNVMIIGAGEAANLIIRDIVGSRYTHMQIKCIIDDDPNKQGRYIQGIKVVGGREKIKQFVDAFAIDEIFIAMPSVSKAVISEIIEICKDTTCKLRTLPGVYQLVNGEVNVSQLKDVDVEDLLGRDPITVDLESILGYVQERCVLVTGGGGSIGSELCRQIAAHKPSRLIIVDIYENNAYDIQQELKHNFPKLNMVVLIASVRNTRRMNWIFEEYRPDIVYHAAAHKHVPLMEDSPNEAIKNNVFGTWKTAQAAAFYGAKKFVLISTDKAVNPTNIMGASKRLCEMVIQSFDRKIKDQKTHQLPPLFTHSEGEGGSPLLRSADAAAEFVAVRFGNVLGSNGSVVPLFQKQISHGGPVTVTHPDIVRYFMTVPEAVSLVLQAGTYASGGEIYVLDMGSPVKIDALARNLIRLSGYRPDVDIEIIYTGLRPGEKLYEEKLMREEGLKRTQSRLIHIGSPVPFDTDVFLEKLERLMAAAYDNDEEETISIVAELVPSYRPEKRTGTAETPGVSRTQAGERKVRLA